MTRDCPNGHGEMKELAPAPADGVDGEPRYECKDCPRVYFGSQLPGGSGE